MFFKKIVLKNFLNFTGKHMYRCLFFNNVTVFQPASLLKRNSGIDVLGHLQTAASELGTCKITSTTWSQTKQKMNSE